jgi:septal ring factor EnvC (AmiA/AmiB activator)
VTALAVPCRRPRSPVVLLLVALLAAGLATAWLVVLPHSARGASEGKLRSTIAGGKARERALTSAAAHLARLERASAKEVAIVEQRLADAQAELNASQARLADTQVRLRAERRRLARLRKRLTEARTVLTEMLRQRYMADRPDLVSVVLDAHGFADLLDRMEFLKRVERSDTEIVDVVRAARRDAGRETVVLTTLEAKRQAETVAVQRERDALAGMEAAAQARRQALAQAHAARLAALRATRASRRSAERTLRRLLAARARAARSNAGPGGPWAIPWAIVQCESGGQNLPPNSAGASGYYQMMPATWKGLGGSTPNAYQASKAEQDRLAAKLWNGGAGASNWVCAALVGVI